MVRARGARRTLLILLVTAAACLAVLPAGTASAGRLFATGHDLDLHCGRQFAQCGYVEKAVRYVREGAPDPTRPVLILERRDNDFTASLTNAFGLGVLPSVSMDPRSATFAAEPLDTGLYSAILIGSDSSCDRCDLNESESTPDSDAINARAADIAAFFRAGGGLLYASGGTRGDGSAPDDVYYRSAPGLAGGLPVAPPFTLTPEGRALGLTELEANCCVTHNALADPPVDSGLVVAERDSAGSAETIFSGGTLANDPSDPAAGPTVGETVVASVESGDVFFRLPPAGGPRAGARASQAARDARPLQRARLLPVGTVLDTTTGRVRLTSHAGGMRPDGRKRTQQSTFRAGIFQVRQRRARDAVTDITLRSPSATPYDRVCATGAAASGRPGGTTAAAAQRRSRRIVSRLWADGSGRFRTRGRHSAATVRGTRWLTQNRCDGTLTVVSRGSVRVLNRHTGRTVTVRAGGSYFARARRATVRSRGR